MVVAVYRVQGNCDADAGPQFVVSTWCRVFEAGHHKHRVAIAPGDAGRQHTLRHAAQAGAEPLEHADRGERAVDGGRQRAHRDLDQFTHRIFEVFRAVPIGAECKRILHRLLHIGRRRLHHRNHRTRKHVVARPHQQAHGSAALGCPVGQTVGVNVLQIAAVGAADRNRAVPMRLRRHRLRIAMRRPTDRRLHVVADQRDHRLHIDAPGHVADEADQRRHAKQGQQQRRGQRQSRHRRIVVGRTHPVQQHQRIGAGGQKHAERELVAAVAREVAQQMWPHLAGRERQRRDRDREQRTGRRQRGAGQGAEQSARSGRAAAKEPDAVPDPARLVQVRIDRRQAHRSKHADSHQQCRQRPEGVHQIVEQLLNAGDHGVGECARVIADRTNGGRQRQRSRTTFVRVARHHGARLGSRLGLRLRPGHCIVVTNRRSAASLAPRNRPLKPCGRPAHPTRPRPAACCPAPSR